MTLDEAIKHAEEVAEEKENEGKLLCQSEGASIGCLTCAEEHRQLAEWLKDYKRLLEQDPYEELDFVQPHKKISVNLEVCKMREATQEEREGVEQYIDSIAKPCKGAISRQQEKSDYADWFCCSECGSIELKKSKYCPNCGVKMEREWIERIDKNTNTYQADNIGARS